MEWSLVFAGILATWAGQANAERETLAIGCGSTAVSPSYQESLVSPAAEKKTWWQKHGPQGEHHNLRMIASKARDCWDWIHGNPNRRMEQMLNTSEDLRQIEDEWSRIWFTDQPSHLTYDRITGGLE